MALTHTAFVRNVQRNMKEMYELLKYIFDFYGCQGCTLCCKAYTPVVQKNEIKKIAHFLKIKPKKFRRNYMVKLDIIFNEYELKAPCPFLNNGRCKIYSYRPSPCRFFPFEFDPFNGIARLVGVEVCPTATQINEELLDFHDKIKHLLPISKEETKEIAEITDQLEQMFVKKREKLGIPQSTGGLYTMLSIEQWLFFAMDRIEKVDDIEDRIENYYKERKMKK